MATADIDSRLTLPNRDVPGYLRPTLDRFFDLLSAWRPQRRTRCALQARSNLVPADIRLMRAKIDLNCSVFTGSRPGIGLRGIGGRPKNGRSPCSRIQPRRTPVLFRNKLTRTASPYAVSVLAGSNEDAERAPIYRVHDYKLV